MNNNLHYFLFSYSFPNGNGSVWFGFSNKNITRTKLNEVKEEASKSLPLGMTAIVTAVSYLGYMTKEEFLDEATE